METPQRTQQTTAQSNDEHANASPTVTSSKTDDVSVVDTKSRRTSNTNSDKRDASLLSAIWYRFLSKEQGWKHRSGVAGEWAFVPASLSNQFNWADIKKRGTEGVHFADGWDSLGTMLSKFGVFHAPRSLDHFPHSLAREHSVKEIYDELFDEIVESGKADKSSAESLRDAHGKTGLSVHVKCFAKTCIIIDLCAMALFFPLLQHPFLVKRTGTVKQKMTIWQNQGAIPSQEATFSNARNLCLKRSRKRRRRKKTTQI
jgi:hypothetical protein